MKKILLLVSFFILFIIITKALLSTTAKITFAQQAQETIEPIEETIPPVQAIILKIIEPEHTKINLAFQDGIAITGLQAIDALNQKYHIESIEPLLIFPAQNSELGERYGFDRMYVLKTANTSLDMKEVADEYATVSEVENAEPEGFLKLNVAPNDTFYREGYQWPLHNTGQYGYTEDSDIDAPEAWNITTGSDDVIIAFVDSGIENQHPNELRGARFLSGYDFGDRDSNPRDLTGHGSAAIGIAAANTNNGTGMAGICWECKILPIKATYQNTLTMTVQAAVNSIVFAADQEAQILFFGASTPEDFETLHAAFEYAFESGMTIFAPTGNLDMEWISYPAAYPEVMGVGALSPCNERKAKDSCDLEWWWGSTYGDYVDFLAPGTDIYTTNKNAANGFWYYSFGQSPFRGTSASAAYAAGIAGLLVSYDPSLTNVEIQTIMQQSAIDMAPSGYDNETGYGALNAYQTLLKANPYKKVFVTSGEYTGNLGGYQGALQICKEHALKAGLPGRYSAWLSTDEVNAKYRLHNEKYVLVNGDVVAEDKVDLLDGSIQNAINRTETGDILDEVYKDVWTGTNAEGISTGIHCNNWTAGEPGSGIGSFGDGNRTDQKWTNYGNTICSLKLHVYCFQTSDEPYPLPSTPTPTASIPPNGKKVFVSSLEFNGNLIQEAKLEGYTGNEGWEAGDYLCQYLAEESGIAGNFIAWLSTTQKNAKDRILNNPYYLLDGTLIANNKNDLLDQSLQHAITMDNMGKPSIDEDVWTGTLANGIAATHLCQNWSTDQKQAQGEKGDSNRKDSGWTSNLFDDCNKLKRIYCFEVNPSPTPTTIPNMKVFVSSQVYQADLVAEAQSQGYSGYDGNEAGDFLCQRLANQADVSGSYRAWLGNSYVDTKDMIPNAQYALLNGMPVAQDKNDLLDSELNHAIDITEQNQLILNNDNVWTGTLADGTSSTTNSQGWLCDAWRTVDSDKMAQYGKASSMYADWTDSGNMYSCADQARIYCFQSSANDPTPYPTAVVATETPLPTPYYFYVFNTSAWFNGELVRIAQLMGYKGKTGLRAGDFLCQYLADTMQLQGRYHAWLSSALVDAKDRIVNGYYTNSLLAPTNWYIAVDKTDLLDGNLNTPNGIYGNEREFGDGYGAWTGTLEDGTREENFCENYNSGREWNTGLIQYGYGLEGWTCFNNYAWTNGANETCGNVVYFDVPGASSQHLYCFQVSHPYQFTPTSTP